MHSRFRAALVSSAAATLVLTTAGLAIASDVVYPDGDTGVPSGNLNYGSGGRACDTRGLPVDGAVVVSYNGGVNAEHFTKGESLGITVDAPAGITVTLGNQNNSVPGSWGSSQADEFAIPFTTTVDTTASGGKVEFTIKGSSSGYTAGAGEGSGRPQFVVNISCGGEQQPNDTERPSLSLTHEADGRFGWNVSSPVTVAATGNDNVGITEVFCTDSIDEAAAVPVPVLFSSPAKPLSTTFDIDGEGVHSLSCVARDAAGNESDPAVDVVEIDTVKPSLNIIGPADGTTFDVCVGPSEPGFEPSDATSGVSDDLSETYDSWTRQSALTLSDWTYYAQAYDVAGNNDHETRTYSARYGSAYDGLLQPINREGNSRFKLGSTIPVKFRLSCNGTPISDAQAKLSVWKKDATPDVGVTEAISTSAATSGNLFRYSASDQQYIFNLSTKAPYKNPNGQDVTITAGTWTLYVDLGDGSAPRTTDIQVTK